MTKLTWPGETPLDKEIRKQREKLKWLLEIRRERQRSNEATIQRIRETLKWQDSLGGGSDLYVGGACRSVKI